MSGRILHEDEVEWVVNDIAELGVKIGDQFFFCYKGRSLVYDPEEGHEQDDPRVGYREGDRMKWRPVFKREFGECIHPINLVEPSKIGTVSYDDSDEWRDLPSEPKVDQQQNSLDDIVAVLMLVSIVALVIGFGVGFFLRAVLS